MHLRRASRRGQGNKVYPEPAIKSGTIKTAAAVAAGTGAAGAASAAGGFQGGRDLLDSKRIEREFPLRWLTLIFEDVMIEKEYQFFNHNRIQTSLDSFILGSVLVCFSSFMVPYSSVIGGTWSNISLMPWQASLSLAVAFSLALSVVIVIWLFAKPRSEFAEITIIALCYLINIFGSLVCWQPTHYLLRVTTLAAVSCLSRQHNMHIECALFIIRIVLVPLPLVIQLSLFPSFANIDTSLLILFPVLLSKFCFLKNYSFAFVDRSWYRRVLAAQSAMSDIQSELLNTQDILESVLPKSVIEQLSRRDTRRNGSTLRDFSGNRSSISGLITNSNTSIGNGHGASDYNAHSNQSWTNTRKDGRYDFAGEGGLTSAREIISNLDKTARCIKGATVLFMGIKIQGLPSLDDGGDVAEFTRRFNLIFHLLDTLADDYGVEKLKTIGTSLYMAADISRSNSPRNIVEFAIAVISELDKLSAVSLTEKVVVKIGLNTGDVHAGVIGSSKIQFDVFGDAVNVSSRIESIAMPGQILATSTTVAKLAKSATYKVFDMGWHQIKGKGSLHLFNIKANEPTTSAAEASSCGKASPSPASLAPLFASEAIENQGAIESDTGSSICSVAGSDDSNIREKLSHIRSDLKQKWAMSSLAGASDADNRDHLLRILTPTPIMSPDATRRATKIESMNASSSLVIEQGLRQGFIRKSVMNFIPPPNQASMRKAKLGRNILRDEASEKSMISVVSIIPLQASSEATKTDGTSSTNSAKTSVSNLASSNNDGLIEISNGTNSNSSSCENTRVSTHSKAPDNDGGIVSIIAASIGAGKNNSKGSIEGSSADNVPAESDPEDIYSTIQSISLTIVTPSHQQQQQQQPPQRDGDSVSPTKTSNSMAPTSRATEPSSEAICNQTSAADAVIEPNPVFLQPRPQRLTRKPSSSLQKGKEMTIPEQVAEENDQEGEQESEKSNFTVALEKRMDESKPSEASVRSSVKKASIKKSPSLREELVAMSPTIQQSEQQQLLSSNSQNDPRDDDPACKKPESSNATGESRAASKGHSREASLSAIARRGTGAASMSRPFENGNESPPPIEYSKFLDFLAQNTSSGFDDMENLSSHLKKALNPWTLLFKKKQLKRRFIANRLSYFPDYDVWISIAYFSIGCVWIIANINQVYFSSQANFAVDSEGVSTAVITLFIVSSIMLVAARYRSLIFGIARYWYQEIFNSLQRLFGSPEKPNNKKTDYGESRRMRAGLLVDTDLSESNTRPQKKGPRLSFRGQHVPWIVSTAYIVLVSALILVITPIVDRGGYYFPAMLTACISFVCILMDAENWLFDLIVIIGMHTFFLVVSFNVVLQMESDWSSMVTFTLVILAMGTITVIERYNKGISFLIYFSIDWITMKQLGHARAEKDNSDMLLQTLMPASIAQRIKSGSATLVAEKYEDVTVLELDIVSFTVLSSRVSSNELIEMLNKIYCAFDDLCKKNGCEKITTIGDAYVAASGIPDHIPFHASKLLMVAFGMLQVVFSFNEEQAELEDEIPGAGFPEVVRIRIGIHSGTYFAAIIGGSKRFKFDILNSNEMQRVKKLEADGLPNAVHISAETLACLRKDPTLISLDDNDDDDDVGAIHHDHLQKGSLREDEDRWYEIGVVLNSKGRRKRGANTFKFSMEKRVMATDRMPTLEPASLPIADAHGQPTGSSSKGSVSFTLRPLLERKASMLSHKAKVAKRAQVMRDTKMQPRKTYPTHIPLRKKASAASP